MDAQPKPNPTPRASATGAAPRMSDIPPASSPDVREDGNTGNPATTAAKSIPKYLAELKAYAFYFLSAELDGFKATGRTIVVYAALGVIGLLVATGIIFTAAFLLLSGLANLLGELFGHRIWLGQIIVAVLVLGGIGVGTWIGLKKFMGASRLETEQEYDAKRKQQRADLRHDLHEPAQRHRLGDA